MGYKLVEERVWQAIVTKGSSTPNLCGLVAIRKFTYHFNRGYYMDKIITSGIFNYAKKIYIRLFNFIVGHEKRKFYRMFAHMAAIFCLVQFPVMFIIVIIQILVNYVTLTGALHVLIGLPISAFVSSLMTKFLIHIS